MNAAPKLSNIIAQFEKELEESRASQERLTKENDDLKVMNTQLERTVAIVEVARLHAEEEMTAALKLAQEAEEKLQAKTSSCPAELQEAVNHAEKLAMEAMEDVEAANLRVRNAHARMNRVFDGARSIRKENRTLRDAFSKERLSRVEQIAKALRALGGEFVRELSTFGDVAKRMAGPDDTMLDELAEKVTERHSILVEIETWQIQAGERCAKIEDEIKGLDFTLTEATKEEAIGLKRQRAQLLQEAQLLETETSKLHDARKQVEREAQSLEMYLRSCKVAKGEPPVTTFDAEGFLLPVPPSAEYLDYLAAEEDEDEVPESGKDLALAEENGSASEDLQVFLASAVEVAKLHGAPPLLVLLLTLYEIQPGVRGEAAPHRILQEGTRVGFCNFRGGKRHSQEATSLARAAEENNLLHYRRSWAGGSVFSRVKDGEREALPWEVSDVLTTSEQQSFIDSYKKTNEAAKVRRSERKKKHL